MFSPPRGALLSCAACLHAIVEPERPVVVQGLFFHPAHIPDDAAGASWGGLVPAN